MDGQIANKEAEANAEKDAAESQPDHEDGGESVGYHPGILVEHGPAGAIAIVHVYRLRRKPGCQETYNQK